MSLAEITDLAVYCDDVARRAKQASRVLATLSTELKNRWLLESAKAVVERTGEILAANQLDLAAAPEYGLTEAQIDRLRLNAGRVQEIAGGLAEVAALPDPIGELIEGGNRPNGLRIEKIRVPLGVVFFIYESRPNVTADAAAICVKSGNAVILRGGKEAIHSSQAIIRCLQDVAEVVGLPEDAVQLVETTDRQAVGHFLRMDDFIDVTIPRGGEGLIRRVTAEATMPVIKHFDGNCHVYIDAAADPEMAVRVTLNAKTQRMGVCNACESVVVHRDAVPRVLADLGRALSGAGVEVRGDADVLAAVGDAVPATEEDWGREYLGPQISICVVDDLQAAIDHINRYGSGHTDAIITRDLSAARRFCAAVDSSAVMVNASTRFNDGGQFGLGAEIGISTDKFHARGPCGLRELTSYKYIVQGEGHVRE